MRSALLPVKLRISRVLLGPRVSSVVRKRTGGTIRRRGLVLDLSAPVIPARLVSQVFFGLYESAELRSIARLRGPYTSVVDLGCSSGVVGATVARLVGDGGYLGVEANPQLVDVAVANVRANSAASVEVVNAAVAYDADTVMIDVTPQLVSTRIDAHATDGIEVPAVQLGALVAGRDLGDRPLLMCDIEGVEWDVFAHDVTALQRFSDVILEVHTTREWTIEQFPAVARSAGFAVTGRDGPVFTLSRVTIADDRA